LINPYTVKAQMEGGIVFGISGALWGEITLENGRVELPISTSIGCCGSTRRRRLKCTS
jgi:hypothetical protein